MVETQNTTHVEAIQKLFRSDSVYYPISNEIIEHEFAKTGHGCLHGIRFDALNINAKTRKVTKGTFFFVAKTTSKPLKSEGDDVIQKHFLIQFESNECNPLKFDCYVLTSYSMTDSQSPLSVLLP